jgi:hypothetical protein
MECWIKRKREKWGRFSRGRAWMIMPLVIHHGAANKSHVTLVILLSVIGMAEQKVNMRLYVNWRRNSYWPWLVNHSLPVFMDRINTIVWLQMNIFLIKECAPNALIKSRTQKWRGRQHHHHTPTHFLVAIFLGVLYSIIIHTRSILSLSCLLSTSSTW